MGYLSDGWHFCFDRSLDSFFAERIASLPIATATALWLVVAVADSTWTKPRVPIDDSDFIIIDCIGGDANAGASDAVMMKAIEWQMTPRT